MVQFLLCCAVDAEILETELQPASQSIQPNATKKSAPGEELACPRACESFAAGVLLEFNGGDHMQKKILRLTTTVFLVSLTIFAPPPPGRPPKDAAKSLKNDIA